MLDPLYPITLFIW